MKAGSKDRVTLPVTLLSQVISNPGRSFFATNIHKRVDMLISLLRGLTGLEVWNQHNSSSGLQALCLNRFGTGSEFFGTGFAIQNQNQRN